MARNILVVEDDNNISDLIRMYLEKEGFEVRIAADGGKAVEEFKAREPDLVLLDVMLPVLDGWGVCAKIRETSKCPIISRDSARFFIFSSSFCMKKTSVPARLREPYRREKGAKTPWCLSAPGVGRSVQGRPGILTHLLVGASQ